MKTDRTYTRRHRVIANLVLLASLWLLWRLAEGQTTSFFVLALLSLAPGLIYYGYFLSSQLCRSCREPVFWLRQEPLLWRLKMFAAPFHVPARCPHCGTTTKW